MLKCHSSFQEKSQDVVHQNSKAQRDVLLCHLEPIAVCNRPGITEWVRLWWAHITFVFLILCQCRVGHNKARNILIFLRVRFLS